MTGAEWALLCAPCSEQNNPTGLSVSLVARSRTMTEVDNGTNTDTRLHRQNKSMERSRYQATVLPMQLVQRPSRKKHNMHDMERMGRKPRYMSRMAGCWMGRMARARASACACARCAETTMCEYCGTCFWVEENDNGKRVTLRCLIDNHAVKKTKRHVENTAKTNKRRNDTSPSYAQCNATFPSCNQ